MSSLEVKTLYYLNNPLPIWNRDLAEALVKHEIQELLHTDILIGEAEYNTTAVYLSKKNLKGSGYIRVNGKMKIEYPDSAYLSEFYYNHALDIMPRQEFRHIEVEAQIRLAISELDRVKECGECISHLVQSIQILRQPEPEFDISFSHPKIPFTVFVSLGEGTSAINTMRLAESILHEAMHLKLSLIEKITPLIADNSQQHFSPWRDECRPIRGVLHAMYVFSAIRAYYKAVIDLHQNLETRKFMEWRTKEIACEISQMQSFWQNPGLTATGSHLSKLMFESGRHDA